MWGVAVSVKSNPEKVVTFLTLTCTKAILLLKENDSLLGKMK